MQPFQRFGSSQKNGRYATIVWRLRDKGVALPLLVSCNNVIVELPMYLNLSNSNSEIGIACVALSNSCCEVIHAQQAAGRRYEYHILGQPRQEL